MWKTIKRTDEITLMTELHHPNIVIFMAACIDEPKKCLVLEYLANGNMSDFLQDASKKINLQLLHRFAVDIARGMKYLHRRCGLIQRDLKSRNLLIDDSFNVKLCDFGLSRFIDSDDELTHAGTPYWTAPGEDIAPVCGRCC
jgi:serine/threonine protein kinase